MEDRTSILKYSFGPGLILGALTIVLAVAFYILNLNPIDDKWTGYVNWALIIFTIYYYQRDFKLNHNDGLLSYGEGVKIGLTIAVIGGIISALYSLVFITLIDPGYVDMIFMKMEAMIAEENPELTQQQLDVAMSFQRKFADPMFSVPAGILSSAIGGLIMSLIVTLFNKKSNAPV